MSGLGDLLHGARDPLGPSGWTAPRVNLLPEAVAARRAVRRAQRGGAAAVVVTALVVAGVWTLGSVESSSEQEALDAATGRVSALQAQQAQYAAAPQTLRALRSSQEAGATAMAQDVSWYAFVDSLSRALPAGAWLDGVQVSLASATDAAAATALDGGTPPLGAVAISARSTSYEDVAGYLDALATVPGVSGAYLTSATLDEGQSQPVVTFTVTAEVTDTALTHRFDATPKAG